MKVAFHKQFEKQLCKLPIKIRKCFSERLELYLLDPTNPLLNVHTLKGELFPYESLNVNSDYRALFINSKSKIVFYEIGTHSQLYK